MLNRLITAIEPFGYTLIILAGASMAGWITFTNTAIVGVVTVFFGVLFTLKHIIEVTQTESKQE